MLSFAILDFRCIYCFIQTFRHYFSRTASHPLDPAFTPILHAFSDSPHFSLPLSLNNVVTRLVVVDMLKLPASANNLGFGSLYPS